MFLSNIEMLALERTGVKVDRNEIQPGEYKADFVIRVFGKITVGEDYEITPVAQIPLYALLAVTLENFGIKSRDNILVAVERAAEMVMNGEIDEALGAEIERVTDDVRKRFAQRLPKKTCRGRVSAKIEVEKMQPAKIKKPMARVEKMAAIKKAA